MTILPIKSNLIHPQRKMVQQKWLSPPPPPWLSNHPSYWIQSVLKERKMVDKKFLTTFLFGAEWWHLFYPVVKEWKVEWIQTWWRVGVDYGRMSQCQKVTNVLTKPLSLFNHVQIYHIHTRYGDKGYRIHRKYTQIYGVCGIGLCLWWKKS